MKHRLVIHSVRFLQYPSLNKHFYFKSNALLLDSG